MRAVLVVLLASLFVAQAVQFQDAAMAKPNCARTPPAGTDGGCVFSGGRCYPVGCTCAGGKMRKAGDGCGRSKQCCIPDGSGYKMNFNCKAKEIKVGKDQADNVAAIKAECKKQGITDKQLAYVLATTTHESQLRPVEEYGVCASAPKKSYCPYSGRGFVQLTHKGNYEKIGKLVGKDLVKNPDLAMDVSIAKYTICYGMKTGLFTGMKLDDYITAKTTDYRNARKIINGMDKADLFACAAQWWEQQIAGKVKLTTVPGPYV